MSVKDIFWFTRRQRVALAIIVIILSATVFAGYYFADSATEDSGVDSVAKERFEVDIKNAEVEAVTDVKRSRGKERNKEKGNKAQKQENPDTIMTF